MKIILMSHFNLASGLKSTLSYFNSAAAEDITAISAYIDDKNPQDELDAVLSTVKEGEKVLIFNDILGGSVNQLCIPYLSNPNFFVFAGMNLGMLLQATCLSDESSDEEIKALEAVGKESVVCVNDFSFGEYDEEDE